MTPSTSHDNGQILSRAATWVAIGTAAFYGVVTVTLFVLAKQSAEVTWGRYVFLYSGLEAVVFAAVGALFGTKVQRNQADSERKRASRAEVEAQQAKADAQQDARAAAAGRALRMAIETEQVVAGNNDEVASGQRRRSSGQERVGSPGGGPDAPPEGQALDRLAILAARLFDE